MKSKVFLFATLLSLFTYNVYADPQQIILDHNAAQKIPAQNISAPSFFMPGTPASGTNIPGISNGGISSSVGSEGPSLSSFLNNLANSMDGFLGFTLTIGNDGKVSGNVTVGIGGYKASTNDVQDAISYIGNITDQGGRPDSGSDKNSGTPNNPNDSGNDKNSGNDHSNDGDQRGNGDSNKDTGKDDDGERVADNNNDRPAPDGKVSCWEDQGKPTPTYNIPGIGKFNPAAGGVNFVIPHVGMGDRDPNQMGSSGSGNAGQFGNIHRNPGDPDPDQNNGVGAVSAGAVPVRNPGCPDPNMKAGFLQLQR